MTASLRSGLCLIAVLGDVRTERPNQFHSPPGESAIMK
jgi:hypothetical protein